MTFAETETIECKGEDSEQVEEVYNYNESEDGETIMVPATAEYKEGEEKNAVRLVQIRFPTSVGGDGRSWLSLVQNTWTFVHWFLCTITFSAQRIAS